MAVISKEIEFTALTPIWTGDANGTSDKRTLESGLIGSLRWWLEALARSKGARVPDPTTSGEEYDPEKKDGGLNPVSLLFGATGWRRRFRMEVLEWGKECRLGRFVINERTEQEASWFFKSGARTGQFKVRLTGSDEAELNVLVGLMEYIAEHGGLGAKVQNGCGVIQVVGDEAGREALKEWLGGLSGGCHDDLPRVDRMFSVKVKPKAGAALGKKAGFELKWKLRSNLRGTGWSREFRHELMGCVSQHPEERIGAKVHFSFPYDAGDGQEMRVWGWIPKEFEGKGGEMLDLLDGGLRTLYGEVDWRADGLCGDSRRGAV